MSERSTFIEKHGLWSDEQRRLAADIERRIEAEKLRFVRLAWRVATSVFIPSTEVFVVSEFAWILSS